MSIELYRDQHHACLMFSDLMQDDGNAVQSNQFLIVDHDHGAIIDPGGNLAFNELLLTCSRFFTPQHLSYLIASHADPDIIASLDRGGILPLGASELHLLPAHFLHSEGNFHFYDPISKILFTGDLGVSLTTGQLAQKAVTDLRDHIPLMEGFHRRYMVSNKVLRLWVAMARRLEISMLVPQHGAPLAGPAIGQFFDWIERLNCGIDLMDARNYQLPHERIDPSRSLA